MIYVLTLSRGLSDIFLSAPPGAFLLGSALPNTPAFRFSFFFDSIFIA